MIISYITKCTLDHHPSEQILELCNFERMNLGLNAEFRIILQLEITRKLHFLRYIILHYGYAYVAVQFVLTCKHGQLYENSQ